ncbi:hypothetical protein WJX82_010784 [Trebouxia sp. C0006]
MTTPANNPNPPRQRRKLMEPGHCLITMYTEAEFLFIGEAIQESHKGQCPHIEHVSSHMQENGSDAFDEQDYSQSADAYEEMRNLQLAQAESAEDDDDANATEEEIDKKTKCLGAKNIAV